MKKIFIVLAVLGVISCGSRNTNKAAENTETTEVIQETKTVKERLALNPDLGEVMESNYQGTIPAADGPGIKYDLTIWNQQGADNGVYQLATTYIEGENGQDKTFNSEGLWSAKNFAADSTLVVYDFAADSLNDGMSFLFYGDSLKMLDTNGEIIKSEFNYTLVRQ